MKQMFKKFRQKVFAFVSTSPSSDSIQEAARQRRNDALVQFAQAAITILIGVWVAPLFQAQAMFVLIAAVLCAVPFVIQGFKIWMSANPGVKNSKAGKSSSSKRSSTRTDKSLSSARRDTRTQASPSSSAQTSQAPEAITPKGQREAIARSAAPEAIATVLSDLQQEGWDITYHLPIPNLGDVNVFLQSPNGNYFIVNVESYRGEVFFDEGVLNRRDWKGVSNFEHDLLQQITEQALAVAKMKRLRTVTPILCFTEATLSIETVNNKARDVYVVKKESLVRKLVRLDKS
jgi:hypothetical protein